MKLSLFVQDVSCSEFNFPEFFGCFKASVPLPDVTFLGLSSQIFLLFLSIHVHLSYKKKLSTQVCKTITLSHWVDSARNDQAVESGLLIFSLSITQNYPTYPSPLFLMSGSMARRVVRAKDKDVLVWFNDWDWRYRLAWYDLLYLLVEILFTLVFLFCKLSSFLNALMGHLHLL